MRVNLKRTLKCVGIILLLVFLLVVGVVLLDPEEKVMRARYDMITLGSDLADVRLLLGMSGDEDVAGWGDDDWPDTIAEESTEVRMPYDAYFPGNRYAIIVYYDIMDKRVTGKQFLRLKPGNGFTRIMRRVRYMCRKWL